MKIRQYCYFALRSATLSAAEITMRLGMEPDEVRVRGSRSAEHVIPRCHAWMIVRRSNESVADQIQHVVDRLATIRSGLVSLCALDVDEYDCSDDEAARPEAPPSGPSCSGRE